jgi:periplasmic divalent cation tolerance protein
VYRWEGRIEAADEAQVILKTRRDRWEALVEAIRQHHPYEVPELLAVPVERGIPSYIAWVGEETRPHPEECA